ncbi:MAG: phosphate acyltransferase, partial [Gemmatimonadota bacterium]|nr:phosphate acyltransferase [Gemmatimonadota bacterium]
MTFLDAVRTRAGASRRRLVFPESGDARMLAAVTEIARTGIADPILVLDPAAPQTHAAARATGLPVVDPTADPRAERVAGELVEVRGRKGLRREQATQLARSPLY